VVDVSGIPALVTGAPTGASYSELHDAFVRSTQSDIAESLLRLLTQLRSGRYPAGRPYRHVNGFTKIVMAEHASARLTLHYWPAAPDTPDDVSRPHDHRFAFSSILLGGSQHFVELEETDDTEAPRWRRFEYRPFLQGRLATVKARGTVGLAQFQIVKRTPLDGYYHTTSKVVHQAVTQRDQACVTLVLRGPRDRRKSKVYYPADEPAPRGGLQFGRYLAQEELVRQVDHALSLVTIM
jgi:hypothetical protein